MAVRAFTVVELLVTLAVASACLSLALPSFHNLLASARATAAVNHIIGAVAVARTQAILLQRTTTLCPGTAHPANEPACLGRNQWHLGTLVFVDDNRNGLIDPGERLLTALPPLRTGERIYWRSFRNRSYLQFHPRGYTEWQNGSFLYCPADGRAEYARMAIVNAQGRVRVARDADGDGIAEDASGQPLACP
ncbi:MAG: GspH/FimT family pseudopilin [Pseudomonadales bacterium]